MMSVNVTTYHYDNSRDGANTNETTLTLQNVNSTDFGKTASLPVDGQIFTEPLIMTGVPIPGQGTHDIVVVATENDTVYAFDAYSANTTPLWKVSLLQTGESAVYAVSQYGNDITPEVGITGTPVIDPTTDTLYVVGAFQQNSGSVTYSQRMYALNLSNGSNVVAPVTIAATVPGTGYGNVSGTQTFSAFWENQRPALTLSNGEVYVGWSSHGDNNPWHGWIIGFNAKTLNEDYIYCDTANGDAGGIWMSGGGLAVDSSGNLYFTTGNGTFDANTGGSDYSMAIEKLTPTTTATGMALVVSDYFSPAGEAALSNSDLDYGCSSVIILPTQTGAYPNEVVTESKWGTMYLNNENSLGGYNNTTNNDLGQGNIYTNTSTSDVHNTMSAWDGHVYIGGDGLPLQMFNVSNGTLTPKEVSETTNSFGTTTLEDGQGTGPTVSSNGTANGIVWAVDDSKYQTGSAVLYAYNASNLGQVLYNSSSAPNNRDQAGWATKFQDAVVANGHVYVAGGALAGPGAANYLTVYGLLTTGTNVPTVTTPASASPATVTGTTVTLGSLATDPSGDAGPVYSWQATVIPSGAAYPTFSVNSTTASNTTVATFYQAGTYTFAVSVTDPTTNLATVSTVNVTVTSTLAGIAITPPSASVVDSATQQFTATSVDQFGKAISSAPTVTWGVTPGGAGGSISTAGLYTAPPTSSGVDTVTATSGSYTASATVDVAVPTVTQQVGLSSYFNREGIINTSATITSAIAGGLDTDGSFFASNQLGNGATSFQVSNGTAFNGSTFTIGPVNASNVVYDNGQTITLPAEHVSDIELLASHTNGTASLNFVANYTDGSSQTVTQLVSDWYAPQGYAGESNAIAMGERYTVSKNNQGHYVIGNDDRTFYIYGYTLAVNGSKTIASITLPTETTTGTQLQIIAMDTVGVFAPTLISTATASPSPATGSSTVLSALATDSTGDAGPVYHWAVASSPINAPAPSISPNNTSGSNAATVTFYQAGSYGFTVTITDPTNGLTTTSTVSLTVNQTLTSISVTPTAPSVYDGRTLQLTATGDDQFGNPLATQPTFVWTVKTGSIGTVNSSSGLYAAPASGSGFDTVTATSGTVKSSDVVTIVAANPAVSSPAAANPSADSGTTTTLSVLAADITGDATPTYSWAATSIPAGAPTPAFNAPSAGTTGVTFYQAGSYTFTATVKDPTNGLTTTSAVTVTVSQTVTTISLTPAGPVSLANGRTRQFTAAAYDQFGNAFWVPPSFTWTVAAGSVGSVTATGLYQAPPVGTGTATVQATAGGVTGTAGVNDTLPAWLGAGSAATWNSASGILTVTGPTSVVADPGTDQPVIEANGPSAAVTISPTAATTLQVHIGGLSLTNGATAVVTSLGSTRTATNHRVLVLGEPAATSAPLLSIDSTSRLDLADNDMVDHDGTLSAVTGLVASGYDLGGSYWTGDGIASSNAAAGAVFALGVAQVAAPGTVDAEPVSAADVEVKYTYYGDANLDGKVDGSDYSLIDAGYAADEAGPGTAGGWADGDFNYDGVVDGSDYALIDNAFNNQGAALATNSALTAATALQVAATANAVSPAVPAVPVPAVSKQAVTPKTARVVPNLFSSTAFAPVAKPAAAVAGIDLVTVAAPDAVVGTPPVIKTGGFSFLETRPTLVTTVKRPDNDKSLTVTDPGNVFDRISVFAG
jgi:hypothetical protein